MLLMLRLTWIMATTITILITKFKSALMIIAMSKSNPMAKKQWFKKKKYALLKKMFLARQFSLKAMINSQTLTQKKIQNSKQSNQKRQTNPTWLLIVVVIKHTMTLVSNWLVIFKLKPFPSGKYKHKNVVKTFNLLKKGSSNKNTEKSLTA